jgi:hypothetical protein
MLKCGSELKEDEQGEPCGNSKNWPRLRAEWRGRPFNSSI